MDQSSALGWSPHLAAWRAGHDMETRGAPADPAAFDRVLAKVPNLPPLPGDELPEGYRRE